LFASTYTKQVQRNRIDRTKGSAECFDCSMFVPLRAQRPRWAERTERTGDNSNGLLGHRQQQQASERGGDGIEKSEAAAKTQQHVQTAKTVVSSAQFFVADPTK